MITDIGKCTLNELSYKGYGYHGGGRKAKAPEEKVRYKTVSISGKPEEIQALKDAAAEHNKTVSRYVIESLT